MNTPSTDLSEIPFSDFLEKFKDSITNLFIRENIDHLSLSRGLPPNIWKEIMNIKPLSVAIPKEFGGRGAKVKECLGVLSSASYESLSLSLSLGINIALFLEPLAKYGNKIMNTNIFKHVLDYGAMGGLMITEPEYGSDALNMKTSSKKEGDFFHIQGQKHWQGLTGLANYWLIASRNENDKGVLSRDLDFFVANTHIENQNIEVVEYYDNAGLYMIPYGLNKVDVRVPSENRLIPESTGIKMLLDILHRSRFQFPGMGMGFIKRMMDEALKQCRDRMIGKSNLLAFDQVQFQLSKLQTYFTICSSMCMKSSQISGIENNLANSCIQANTMKALVTDMMQESAQTLVQLSGAKGFRTTHVGGRGIMDSRPFQIFEGSNEMLYTQIAEGVIKEMKQQKFNDFGKYMLASEITKNAAKIYFNELNFTLPDSLSQRKLIDLGKIISRVISINDVLELNNAGFNQGLVDNSIEVMRHEIINTVSSMKNHKNILALDEYNVKSSWLDFVD